MAPTPVQQQLQTAVQLQQQGRFAEAQAIYDLALAVDPGNADAWHLLGVLNAQTGRPLQAVELIIRAIKMRPKIPAYQANLAAALRDLENSADAAGGYRAALEAATNSPEVLPLMAQALKAAGRLNEAAAAYRQAIGIRSDEEALYTQLGQVMLGLKNLPEAIAAFRRAVELKPAVASMHFNLGLALSASGQATEALAALNQTIRLNPDLAPAWNNLGQAIESQGRLEHAIEAYKQAVRLQPDLPEAHYNLGRALYERGSLEQAIGSTRRAIELRPDFTLAIFNLGNALSRAGRVEEAVVEYRKALAIKPDFAEAMNNLGLLLRKRGDAAEAESMHRRAITLRPGASEIHNNLGSDLSDLGRPHDALAAIERAVALDPKNADAVYNLANGLRGVGRVYESIAQFRRAISLRENFESARWNLSLALLLTGQLTEGFAEYEWRWRRQDSVLPRPNFSQPQWDGSPLNGRTILLHPEQGFGDTIHFARYAGLLSRLGGRVVIECQPELLRLLRGLTPDLFDGAPNAFDPDVQIIPTGQPLPPFDVHCRIMSLPLALGTTLSTIPAQIPYLRALPDLSEKWKQRLGDRGSATRIGLAWAGRPTHRDDRARSMRLSDFAPLAEAGDFEFLSLQKGEAGSQIQTAPAGLHVHDLTAELHDFADTAATIDQLDLVITVDTAVAHVAGAMGKPVWILLNFVPDWRWMLDRADSPWYPTARLFRQRTPGDWGAVIKDVAVALGETFAARA